MVNKNDIPTLLCNDTTVEHHWLYVRWGLRVIATASVLWNTPGRRRQQQLREINAGSNYLSYNSPWITLTGTKSYRRYAEIRCPRNPINITAQ